MERIGIIGAGRIGGSLITGIADDFDVIVSDVDGERLHFLSRDFDVSVAASNVEVAEKSDLLVVAVKPWDVLPVLEEISTEVSGKVVVSVAAGISIPAMAATLPENTAILRVMPNVCAVLGRGSAVVAANDPGQAYLPQVKNIFERVGDVVELPERLFDAATALHGSGPAYVALFADALVQAGVREGIPREIAKRLVNGTIAGTASLLQEKAAHQVRDEVTTPGGTTAAALAAIEKGGFVAAVYDGIRAATEQGRRLAG